MSIDLTTLLIPYQRRWVADRARVKVWEKSRRVGASYCEALASVLEAAKSREAGGQSTYYLSYNKEMTQQFIKDCAFWAKVVNAAAGEVEELVLRDEDKDITVYRIRFASGYDIWGLPSEPRSLRSKQGRVILDEAAFVDDLRELLKAALALLMWGGSVRVMSTHNGEDNPFNELVQDIRAGRKKYSLHRTTLDDALADGLYQTICRATGQEWTPEAEEAWRAGLIADYGDGADEELFCIPSKSSGAYLTRPLIESCMVPGIPVIRWEPPAKDFVDWPLEQAEAHTLAWLDDNVGPLLAGLPSDRPHYFGQDFGRSGDLTDIWPATEQADLSLDTPFILELFNCPHRTQEQMLFYVVNRLPRFSGGALDARGNGSALAEAARQEYGPGFIEEVMITESWYREVMPKVKARFEDRTLTAPKDESVLSDLRSLRVVRGVARVPDARTKDAKGMKRHGDSAVALGMLVYAVNTLGTEEPWECETVNMGGGVSFEGG